MTGPTAPRFYETTRPPPTEQLAIKYFSPLLAPTPVSTRVPSPGALQDTVNGYLRVEAGGGTLRPDQLLYDISIILHAYANNSDEFLAEELMQEALAWGANAQGTITTMTNGDQWYVQYSRVAAYSSRQADPTVPLTRYRAMITWRMPGLPVVPGHSFSRYTPPERTRRSGPKTPTPSGANIPRPTRKKGSGE